LYSNFFVFYFSFLVNSGTLFGKRILSFRFFLGFKGVTAWQGKLWHCESPATTCTAGGYFSLDLFIFFDVGIIYYVFPTLWAKTKVFF
jgi:hypothetical protein